MDVFVVLDLVFCHAKPRDWLDERLQNYLFCVEWDVQELIRRWDSERELFTRHRTCRGSSL